jgi:hypothetical protein
VVRDRIELSTFRFSGRRGPASQPLAELSVADVHALRCSVVSASPPVSRSSRFASVHYAHGPGIDAIEEEQGTEIKAGRTGVRCAISVPLTPVTKGPSRTLTASLSRRSGHAKTRTAQLPKLIVRVRFSSAARANRSGDAPIALRDDCG